MNFVNCTPHAIALNDGRVFQPSGNVARVSVTFTEFSGDICRAQYGQITGVPKKRDGTLYIVSSMVLEACNDRSDLVAPATGHPDCVRNEKGQIVSVPGFVWE